MLRKIKYNGHKRHLGDLIYSYLYTYIINIYILKENCINPFIQPSEFEDSSSMS